MNRHISVSGTGTSGAVPGPVRFNTALAEVHDVPVAPGMETATVEVRLTVALS